MFPSPEYLPSPTTRMRRLLIWFSGAADTERWQETHDLSR